MAESIYRVGDTSDRPLPAINPEAPPIIQALRYGVTAPSAHNTQPWRIEIASATKARLFFDPDRMLPETDPPGRQVHISHGTLLEMTAIAATTIVYRAQIEILPEGDMSIPEFGTKPTGVVQLLKEPGIQVDALFKRVLHRRTSRLLHEGPPLAADERRWIAEAAQCEGIEIGWVPDALLDRMRDIVSQAMAIEMNDRELFDETRIWWRFSDREISEKGDGLHFDTSGLTGVSLLLSRWLMGHRNWHAGYSRDSYIKRFGSSARSTRALLTLITRTNTMRDWIKTGRAYLRAQLAADELGLRFQPVSQVLQEYPQMNDLRREVEQLLGVAEPAKLQMLVRVGRTKQPGLSPRRGLASIIRS